MLILSWPAIYALELTPACNNRCPGCSNIYAGDRIPPPMSASAWEAILAACAPEAVQIRLTGGEPTLHPEFWRILEAATRYEAEVTIFTNGRWLNPAYLVRQLRDWPRVTGLLISLHGAQPATHEKFSGVSGSFEETAINIRLAVENGIPVALSTIITHHNWSEVEAVVELGQQLGAQQVAFNRYLGRPLPGIEPTPIELRTAINRIENLRRAGAPVRYGICIPHCFLPNNSEGCLAGVAYVSIDPWGNMRPCAHSPTVVGSLCETPVSELWHNEAMQAWRALMPAECPTCAAYSVCHGGCRAVQELRPTRRDPLRQQPLAEYFSPPTTCELPAEARPRAMVRLRPEPFGYALLGRGQVVPVLAEARTVIEACDGNSTFAQLAERFGPSGLALLGDLWQLGMLEAR